MAKKGTRQFPFEHAVVPSHAASLRACMLAATDLCGEQEENWTTRWAEDGSVVFCFDSEACRDAFKAYLSIAHIQ